MEVSVWIKRGLLALLGIALVWLGSLLLQSPETQLRNAQDKLMEHLETRSWFSVMSQMSDTYLDDWGQDSSTAHNAMRHVLGGFTELHIEQEFVKLSHAPATKSAPALGMVRVHLRVTGKGQGLSDMVIAEAARLEEPWYFHWRKEGMWPWSWRLTQVHHDDLRLP